MSRPSLVAAAALCLFVACGDDAVLTPDGGSTDAAEADAGSTTPVPPDIPWLAEGAPPVAPPDVAGLVESRPTIALTPCPAGWRTVAPAGPEDAATCEPYPAGGPAVCAAGQAHFPGEPGCAAIGHACPADDWPEGLPPTGVVHVQPGAPAGGDGSRTSPFALLSTALAGAASGATIALARGRHVSTAAPTVPVTIVGACAADTVITPVSLGALSATLEVNGVGPVVVRGVTIADGPGWGVALQGAGADLELDGVEIASATGLGVFAAAGARLVARSLVVRDTRPEADATGGQAFNVEEASVELSRVVLERNLRVGIRLSGIGTSLQLADATIRDTEGQSSDGAFGRALAVQSGASADVSRTLIERSREHAIFAALGTLLRMTDVIVRDTETQTSNGAHGRGLQLLDGSDTEIRRALIERNREAAVFVGGPSAVLRLEDAVVRDTTRADGVAGRGVAVEAGGRADVSRVLVQRNVEVGVAVSGFGATAQLADLVVRDTRSRHTDGWGGQGLGVKAAATIDGSRVVVEGNREAGVAITGEETTARLSELVVRDTDARPTEEMLGIGVVVEAAARLDLARAVLERNTDAGVYVGDGGSALDLTDIVVRETRARPSDGEGGIGVAAADGASLVASRIAVERNNQSAMLGTGAGTTLVLADLRIADTRGRGGGLEVGLGASVVLDRAIIEGGGQIDILLNGEGAPMQLRDIASRNPAERADDWFGRGMDVQAGVSAEISRALFDRNRGGGIVVSGGAMLELSDAVVRDTESRTMVGFHGHGLSVARRGHVTATRTMVERAREVGVYASGFGTTVELTDFVARDTRFPACTDEGSCARPSVGVGAWAQASVDARRFLVDGSELCGVEVAELGGAASLDLHDGVVTHNDIGACIQVEGYDLSRLIDNVAFVDNGVNSEFTSLPAPGSAEATEL